MEIKDLRAARLHLPLPPQPPSPHLHTSTDVSVLNFKIFEIFLLLFLSIQRKGIVKSNKKVMKVEVEHYHSIIHYEAIITKFILKWPVTV